MEQLQGTEEQAEVEEVKEVEASAKIRNIDLLFEGVENLGAELWKGGTRKEKGASSKQRSTELKSQFSISPFSFD